MREENPIEVAISLLWNASIHFIYHYCAEKCIYTYSLLTVTVLIWKKAVKSQMVYVQKRFKDL